MHPLRACFASLDSRLARRRLLKILSHTLRAWIGCSLKISTAWYARNIISWTFLLKQNQSYNTRANNFFCWQITSSINRAVIPQPWQMVQLGPLFISKLQGKQKSVIVSQNMWWYQMRLRRRIETICDNTSCAFSLRPHFFPAARRAIVCHCLTTSELIGPRGPLLQKDYFWLTPLLCPRGHTLFRINHTTLRSDLLVAVGWKGKENVLQ